MGQPPHRYHYETRDPTADKGGCPQVLKRMKTDIIQHIRQNLVLYLIILFAFLTGAAAGSFTAGSMTEAQKNGLSGYLQRFFGTSAVETIDRGAVFWESIWQYFQSAFLIWLSGLFFFGIPFILLLVGARGFFIGFTAGFIIGRYGFGGFLFTLVCILPQTIVYVVGMLGIGVLSFEYSLKKFKNRKVTYTREQQLKNIMPYSLKITALFLPVIIACLFEAFVTPIFFGLFRWIF
jgi:stage II sporulation protein M